MDIMEDVVRRVTFFLEEVREIVPEVVNRLRQGQEVVRWIEYELETLIPQLDRIEAALTLPAGIDDRFIRYIREAIRRAEDLAETHTKTEIRRDAATFKYLIFAGRVLEISWQLHHSKQEISKYRKQLQVALRRPSEAEEAIEEQQQQQQQPPPTGSSYLRRCLRHLLLFPPDIPVPARRLIALWVAEGLVHPKKHTNESAEQIAERYLNELIDRDLILCASRSRSGRVKSCKIDKARWDALMKDASDFLKDTDGKIKRLVDGFTVEGADSYIEVYSNTGTVSHPVREYRSVISFSSFNTQEGDKPGLEIGGFLTRCISARCFIWLNVLDLERVFRPKLPDTLGKLIALKYLGLRWTYLELLPDSVDKLFSLQVLDVKHTYISVLPRSIWRMQYLRHLYLSEAYRTRFPDPQSKVTLTALQTLWGTFVDEDTPVVRGLSKLLNIRKLGLACRTTASNVDQMSKQLEAIDTWISKLEFLESLRLKSRDANNKPVHLRLSSLERNRKLSVLYLLGKLDRRILCRLPVSLTNVTLSGSELDLDPLEFLGRLPNLMILRLFGQSVVCNKMRCVGRGFQKLKVLWIWKLDKLEDLEAEGGCMPCLEELEIRSCRNLKPLPRQLRHVHELKLTSMPLEFVQREAVKYAKVEHVPSDDQYILTNNSETDDPISFSHDAGQYKPPTIVSDTENLISSSLDDDEYVTNTSEIEDLISSSPLVELAELQDQFFDDEEAI